LRSGEIGKRNLLLTE